MDTRVESRNHNGFAVRTTGLFASSENPFIACSPDGIVSKLKMSYEREMPNYRADEERNYTVDQHQ